jgi:hypothetical protein
MVSYIERDWFGSVSSVILTALEAGGQKWNPLVSIKFNTAVEL